MISKDKDILTIACQRSRIHFTINSIGCNFNRDCVQIDVPPTLDKNILKNFFFNYQPTGKNILKSHHQYETLESFKDIILKKFNILYIIREGRDVMTSCHYYFNKAGNAFPRTRTVSELMKINPQPYNFDKVYSEIKSNTMVERWARHVLGWINNREDWFEIINTDNLYFDFKKSIDIIGNIIKEKSNNTYMRPLVGKSRAVAPRKGVIGDFLNHFSDADNEYFFKEINKIDIKKKLYTIYFDKYPSYWEYNN